jgi:SAM-dependent methyltransferase
MRRSDISAGPAYQPAQFWENLLSREFSLLGVGHGGYGPRYNQWLYRAKARAFERAIRRAAVEIRGTQVLDLGAGTGFFIGRYLAKGARRLCGVDITSTAVDRLRRQFPAASFERADISESLPLADESFDIVHCFDVLYHITEDTAFQTALENIARVCRAGGTVLLVDSLGRRTLAPRAHGPGDIAHVKFRPVVDYRPWLIRWNLRIVAIIPMYFLLNRPIVGKGFPWSSPRLSWSLRYRLMEMPGAAATLYLADNFLTRAPVNSSLKIMVLRRQESET